MDWGAFAIARSTSDVAIPFSSSVIARSVSDVAISMETDVGAVQRLPRGVYSE
jgi:hypothetical protein